MLFLGPHFWVRPLNAASTGRWRFANCIELSDGHRLQPHRQSITTNNRLTRSNFSSPVFSLLLSTIGLATNHAKHTAQTDCVEKKFIRSSAAVWKTRVIRWMQVAKIDFRRSSRRTNAVVMSVVSLNWLSVCQRFLPLSERRLFGRSRCNVTT